MAVKKTDKKTESNKKPTKTTKKEKKEVVEATKQETVENIVPTIQVSDDSELLKENKEYVDISNTELFETLKNEGFLEKVEAPNGSLEFTFDKANEKETVNIPISDIKEEVAKTPKQISSSSEVPLKSAYPKRGNFGRVNTKKKHALINFGEWNGCKIG